LRGGEKVVFGVEGCGDDRGGCGAVVEAAFGCATGVGVGEIECGWNGFVWVERWLCEEGEAFRGRRRRIGERDD
jgi:hypothetical protein